MIKAVVPIIFCGRHKLCRLAILLVSWYLVFRGIMASVGCGSLTGRCRVCRGRATYWVPWANSWFCREHFIEYIERGVRRTFEKYVPGIHRRVLFAVSGGKDSITVFHALAPYLVEKGFEVAVLFIDLGIGDYSRVAKRIVEENTNALGVDLIVADLSSYGFTIADVAELVARKAVRRPVCSICGLVKRYIMNRTAYEGKYDLIVTGHNLDDALGFILHSIMGGNIEAAAKLRPYTPARDGLVAKARPLIYTYEAETQWYVDAKKINYLSIKCPYTPREESIITRLKQLLREIDRSSPGYMKMALRNLIDKLLSRISVDEETRLVKCSICGMTASTDPCGFCRTRRMILKYLDRKNSDR